MTDWLRMWHGAPTDPKWRTIARRAGVRPGDVWSVVSLLMDRASQAQDRGNVEGYDCEIIADALGYEPEDVSRIIDALIDKSVIVNGRLASWEKYQPKREDTSTDRVREHRARKAATAERNVTQGNAPEESREETDTKADALDAKAASVDPTPISEAPSFTTVTDELWGVGIPTLVSLGAPEKGARSFVGMMISSRHDPGSILGAIQRARDLGSGDPIPLVRRMLEPAKVQQNERHREDRRSTAAIDRLLAEHEAHGFG